MTLWDITEVAERLGITERFVRRLVAERRIPYIKVGRFVRFDPDDLADWIRAARIPPRPLSQPFSMIAAEVATPLLPVCDSVSRR